LPLLSEQDPQRFADGAREGHLQGLREGNAVKALGLTLLALGAFLTFIVASSYHAWQSFGIIVLIGGLVTFAAGCVPAE
jgi:hypothetical protein